MHLDLHLYSISPLTLITCCRHPTGVNPKVLAAHPNPSKTPGVNEARVRCRVRVTTQGIGRTPGNCQEGQALQTGRAPPLAHTTPLRLIAIATALIMLMISKIISNNGRMAGTPMQVRLPQGLAEGVVM